MATTDQEGGAMPKRVQRQRTKGWRMPENTVYVGRPTKWGNPFPVSRLLNREHALDLFDILFGYEPNEPLTPRQKFFQHKGQDYPTQDIAELRGKNLACWCALDQPCHADTLLAYANYGLGYDS